jgi:hypothetical protein
MEITTRKTKCYTFQRPDVSKLRDLGLKVASRDDFQEHHGKLLDILKIDATKGVLETLVQFYDLHCHCFTFPDYQLVPSLEEYSHLVGLPVLDMVPFSGLEPMPKLSTMAEALRLKPSVIKDNLIEKKGISGFSTDFLYDQAFIFEEAGANYAFYSILALLIYGLVLFPNVPDFVDRRAIEIFLTKNPVPTLLANTYHSIHDRTCKGRGAILCCAPLLYKWFVSHLPRSFIANRENIPWSRKIMALTSSDIVWYHPTWDNGTAIIRCGDYPNVPLIGMEGGISYNPILARRQLGYPMKTAPNSLALTNEFYCNEEGHLDQRKKFAQAWRSIHRLKRNQLGKRDDFMHGSYIQWVISKAIINKMPYKAPRLVSATIPSSSLPLPSKTLGEHQEQLDDKDREIATWKRRYDEAMVMVEERDEEIRGLKSKNLKQGQQLIKKNSQILAQSARLAPYISNKERMDFFAGADSDSEE